MKYVLDSHTHTLASGHAYNTVSEMAAAAAEKGLEMLAITEHGPKIPGACHEIYFMNLKVIPRKMFGIELLMGAEVNIVDSKGHLDLPERILQKLDVVLASLHVPCIAPGTVSENTAALVGAIENPLVNIIAHPDDGRYPVDFDTVVAAAAENGKLLELNNSSLTPGGARVNARENDEKMLERCMHYKTPVILNSDAHWKDDIGNCTYSMPLLEEMHFPEELVVNTSVELYKKYTNLYK